jgi:hypothetical protein
MGGNCIKIVNENMIRDITKLTNNQHKTNNQHSAQAKRVNPSKITINYKYTQNSELETMPGIGDKATNNSNIFPPSSVVEDRNSYEITKADGFEGSSKSDYFK